MDEALTIFSDFPDTGRYEYRECLALTLAIRAEFLEKVGFNMTALKSVKMAIEWQGPLFLSNPERYEQITEPMIKLYRRLCETRGRRPDAQLLDPIERELARIKSHRASL